MGICKKNDMLGLPQRVPSYLRCWTISPGHHKCSGWASPAQVKSTHLSTHQITGSHAVLPTNQLCLTPAASFHQRVRMSTTVTHILKWMPIGILPGLLLSRFKGFPQARQGPPSAECNHRYQPPCSRVRPLWRPAFVPAAQPCSWKRPCWL